MWKELRPAAVVFVLLTIVTGVVYPLVVTGIAQTTMRSAANGSLIVRDGKPVGSALIGQPFSDPKYFWGRPSATGPQPYNGMASSGSNQGPTNPALTDAIKDRIAALKAADPDNKAPVPIDLVSASASGLDPHISPAAAEYQIARVARVRQMPVADLRRLVEANTERRDLGILGEPGVNVLKLNLALDGAATAGKP
jgi:K+-transporting ATPase ATPase C chain